MIIGVCDDYQTDAAQLEDALKKETQKLNIEAHIRCYDSAEDLLNEKDNIRLLFLDIMMNNEAAGIEAARKIRENNNDIVIVFVSNDNGFATESYEVEAAGYIMKPVTDHLEKLDNLLKKYAGGMDEGKLIKLTGNWNDIMISENSIVRVIADGKKSKVVTNDPERGTIITTISIKNLEEMLSKDKFVRTGKSDIVSFSNIIRIEGSNIVLKSGEAGVDIVKIGTTYRAEVLAAYDKYVLSGML